MGTFYHKAYIAPVGAEVSEEMMQKRKNVYLNALTNCVFSFEKLTVDHCCQYYEFKVTFDEPHISKGSWQ